VEVLIGVIAVPRQRVKGTTVSLLPYLLNLILHYCKHAQDLGKKFHYSWFLILISIIGWKEPNYTFFATKPKLNHGARYLSLGATPDANHMKMNIVVFEGYLCEL
jgi:hypothetical protein